MKDWYQSATLWTNLILLLTIVTEEILQSGALSTKYMVYGTIVLNVLLRLKTNKGIKI